MKKLLFIASIVCISSCNDIENCDTNDEQDFMIVRFFDIDTRSAKQVGFTITAEDSPFQFVPFDDSTGVGLPLNPSDTNATFYFDSLDIGLRYELSMTYETDLSIFDPSCDPSISFSNLDTLRQTFDSTIVVGTVTNRQLSTNVEIYF